MNIENIYAEDVKRMIDNKEDVQVVDVREDFEVAQGMIPDAIHIPLGHLPEGYNLLDTDRPIVVVCRSGARSMNACMFLKSKGIDCKNLYGGMFAWESLR